MAQYSCMFVRTLFYLREYFFPSGCGGCGEALFNREDARYGLCAACRAFLAAALAPENRCQICGKFLISEKLVCLSCRKEASDTPACDQRIVKPRALFPYTGKYKRILFAYKFRKSLGVGNFLAQCLNERIADFAAGEEAVWVPVPPRPGKIKKQGWDQVEYLAGLLEKNKRYPLCRCLKRLPSESQKALNREGRAGNLKGRILCVKKPPETALLFDDVITTGATLNACARALLESGTKKVYGAGLFYD